MKSSLSRSVVVFDFLSDPMGGLLTSARAFLNRVRQFDKETTLLVLEANKAVSTGVLNPNDFDWVNIDRPGGLRSWRRLAWQNTILPGLLRDRQASVYVSLSHYLPLILPAGVRSIIGVSNLAPFSQDAYSTEISPAKRLRLRVLRRTVISAAKRADRVIALSEAGRVELVNRGVSSEKIRKIPNGVTLPEVIDATSDLQAPSPFGLADGFLLCVSHFYRYKNFARLVEAYSRLPASLREQHPLVLVGAPYDAGYLEEIRELAKKLGIGQQVRIIPGAYGVDLAALYRRCHVFVFPSLVENSPITLLEALSHGAVVAASDVAAMREFGGDAGIYFDPHSVSEMASIFAKVITDDALRAKLKARGPEQSAAYTWEKFTVGLVDTYRELLS